MPIGTSDGEFFSDHFDYTLNSTPKFAKTKDVAADEGITPYNPATDPSNFEQMGMKDWKPLAEGLAKKWDPDFPIIGPKVEADQPYIDRSHDVPLGAAALVKDGEDKAYGTAVDRRVPLQVTIHGVTFDPAQFVHIHEMAEHPHMENLIAHGLDDLEAYAKAHDEIATPTEKAAVMAFAKKQGSDDPEDFWSQYQKHWSTWVKNAQAQDPEKVHPHTYLKPYQPDLRAKMEQLSMLPIKSLPVDPEKGPQDNIDIDPLRLNEQGKLPTFRGMKVRT